MTTQASGSPVSSFYNLSAPEDSVVTADIDWAPDYAVEFMLAKLEELHVPATVFATHRQRSLVDAGALVRVGLHPDPTRALAHTTATGMLQNLLDIYPEAVGLRCHRNFFGQNIAESAAAVGLRYDASHVSWQLPWAQAFVDQFGLVRFSYTWEDGLHCDFGLPLDSDVVDLETPGLKVLNIHPLLFFLNCVTDDDRRAAVRSYSDLTSAPYSELSQHVRHGWGIRDVTISLIERARRMNMRFAFLDDAADAALNVTEAL